MIFLGIEIKSKNRSDRLLPSNCFPNQALFQAPGGFQPQIRRRLTLCFNPHQRSEKRTGGNELLEQLDQFRVAWSFSNNKDRPAMITRCYGFRNGSRLFPTRRRKDRLQLFFERRAWTGLRRSGCAVWSRGSGSGSCASSRLWRRIPHPVASNLVPAYPQQKEFLV